MQFYQESFLHNNPHFFHPKNFFSYFAIFSFSLCFEFFDR